MTGFDYRETLIRSLTSMKFQPSILTPLASMFRDITSMTKDERTIIIGKICENMQKLDPMELPALAFQLFSMCNTPTLIIIPIFGFEKYFYKHFYKKLFSNLDSETTDFDSIDTHSDNEYRESEETILYHLSGCTEFRVSEKEIVTIFKNISATPTKILTPFMVSAILTMCNNNRYPDSSSLSSSPILTFLRSIIKNNEDEKEMTKKSVWCRNTIDSSNDNIDNILSILIDQNKEGMDVVTPGLVGLGFTLLKAKNCTILNTLGISFLEKFIKKRFVFGPGILKNVTDFLLADQESIQYGECLTKLSLTNTMTVTESSELIKNVLNYFLVIPGNHAMRIMSFVFPLIKISHTIRDTLIDILKKAMYNK